MLKPFIHKVVEGISLTEQEAMLAMEAIMEGQSSEAQLACLITALKMKGETAAEISGFARVMTSKAEKIPCNSKDVVDTCGTGGDGAQTFNISTTAAFIAAGCGLKIAKHGNRSVSSRCGSADVLERLGVNLDISPKEAGRCIDEVNLGFLFAPLLHKAMKHAAGPRKEIAIRTIFNLLGPLTNPAGAKRQLLGVYSEDLTGIIGEVLLKLGTEHALVVHGLDGMDEISLCSPTKITEVKKGKLKTYVFDPTDISLKKVPSQALKGGGIQTNANILLSILQGKEKGPTRDIALLNAGAALVVGGMAESFQEGYYLAEKGLDRGEALLVLEGLKELTKEVQVS